VQSRLIGLYDGGGYFHCGVYHPAGRCLMRNQDDATTFFCAVCRYVLTEVFDPPQHGRIDRDYESIFHPEGS
jgi:hypothetical protein